MAAEFIPNEEAASIGADLITKYHTHLIGLKIAYLSKVGPQPKKPKAGARLGKKITIAKVSKVSPKTVAIATDDFKFVVEFDWWIWEVLTPEQRIAVVDHELCHCKNDADGVFMVKHDLEEFRATVERHGFYLDDIRQFAETAVAAYHAQQIASPPETVDLFIDNLNGVVEVVNG